MAQKLIFLSHIHDERELAILIKSAIEEEFAGFVGVFVSSDGTTIPAGANLLKRIEAGLMDCVAALYLISPRSVTRPWINFELGAVWVRSALSQRSGNAEIPALPLCHSGATPGNLPSPLGNLNAVEANDAAQLEFAFRSIQAAVGASGKLRTDFHDLAQKVRTIEKNYTMGANAVRMLKAAGGDIDQLLKTCKALDADSTLTLQCRAPTEAYNVVKDVVSGPLQDVAWITYKGAGTAYGPAGAVNEVHFDLTLHPRLVLEFEPLLLAAR